MPAFTKLHWKQVGSHVGVGMLAASFWRGAWYILDDQLFPDNEALSCAASLGLGTAGMAASQGLVQKSEEWALQWKKQASASTSSLYTTKVRAVQLKLARFGALYSIALSCVLVWRGTWMLWDVAYEQWRGVKSTSPVHATHSGVLSHSLAAAILLGGGVFASVLAPPAAASVIQDLAVKAGQGGAGGGPAARVARHFFSKTTSATATASVTANGASTGTIQATGRAATTRALHYYGKSGPKGSMATARRSTKSPPSFSYPYYKPSSSPVR